MTSPEYGDTPYVRQLIVERTADIEQTALEATTAIDEESFPTPLKLLKKWVVGHLNMASSESRMDCAEVVATTYQCMGLLAAEPPVDAYWPRSFSAQHEKVRLLKGAALGPQMQVLCSNPMRQPPRS